MASVKSQQEKDHTDEADVSCNNPDGVTGVRSGPNRFGGVSCATRAVVVLRTQAFISPNVRVL